MAERIVAVAVIPWCATSAAVWALCVGIYALAGYLS